MVKFSTVDFPQLHTAPHSLVQSTTSPITTAANQSGGACRMLHLQLGKAAGTHGPTHEPADGGNPSPERWHQDCSKQLQLIQVEKKGKSSAPAEPS